MRKFKIHFVSGRDAFQSVTPKIIEGDEMHFSTDYFRIERVQSSKRTAFACPREHLLYCQVVEEENGRTEETSKGSTT